MRIKDFFKGKISEILENHECVKFDEDEFQYAKLIIEKLVDTCFQSMVIYRIKDRY